MERESEVFKVNPNVQPDLDSYSYLIQRQLRPEARTDIKGILQGLEVRPCSMIDVSDGLSSELIHLCDQSEKGCTIYEDKIPLEPSVISTCEEFKLNPATIALNGGEDYELLFTLPIEAHEKIKNNPHLTIIGHITRKEKGIHIIGTDNQTKIPLTAQGWDAFLKK